MNAVVMDRNETSKDPVRITGRDMDFKELNYQLKKRKRKVVIDHCNGQRFIGSGLKKDRTIVINGTPGNALGAYLDGADITVHGNAQDAVGDTMNCGKIVIHGNAGDALGYAMRGGCIYVKGDAGYRTGIHMKEYQNKKPVIVVGGRTGSFLGEYLAGGLIIVLGLGSGDLPVGHFTGTGMHGGRILIRTNKEFKGLPSQIVTEPAGKEDLDEIGQYVYEFASLFNINGKELLKDRFYVLRPSVKNHYKQLYTIN